MNDYSNHIAIIGAGIAGLALGNFLKENNIPCLIFEKSKNLSLHSAGISISPNGLKIIKELDILEDIKKISGNPKSATFYSKFKKITKISVDVITTSRKSLYKVLYDKYTSMDGEIIFDHELTEFDLEKKLLIFSNNDEYRVFHIVACDGIKSICREKICETIPVYSGYSVWRAILPEQQENIKFHLNSNSHIVTYPISDKETSFIAAVKTKNKQIESWRSKGSFDELKLDLPSYILDKFKLLHKNENIFKWGVYIRSESDILYKKNITFLGDAAHPIVPFLGQGGCLALEDAYIFGKLVIKHKFDLSEAQILYNKIRSKRIKKIRERSLNQAKLNHIKNPILKYIRNFLMRHTNIISFMTSEVWNYDAHNKIKEID